MDCVNRSLTALCGIALAAMVLSVFVGVLARFVFTHIGIRLSVPWTEEVSRYLMIWTVFVGGGVACRHGKLIGVEAVVNALPAPLGRAVKYLSLLLAGCFYALLCFIGWQWVEFGNSQTSPVLEIPMVTINLAMVAGGVLMLLNTVALVIATRAAGLDIRSSAQDDELTGTLEQIERSRRDASGRAGAGLGRREEAQLERRPLHRAAVLLALSVPIAVTLGLSSVIALQVSGTPLVLMAQSVYESLDSFGLMAIPFFVLAGTLMQGGGIAQRLVDLANALVGWIRGGLGACVVLTSMFFATMSGSSSATTAAIGSVLIPAMEKKGYPRNLAGAIAAASGELGVIIPPSIPMIVYALAANVSVADLFLAGILPGLLIGASLIGTVYVLARINGFDVVADVSFGQWLRNLLLRYTGGTRDPDAGAHPGRHLRRGFHGDRGVSRGSGLRPVRQASTATGNRVEGCLPMLGRSAVTSSIILLIVGFAAIFAYILTVNQVPHKVGAFVSGFSKDPLVFLLIVNLLLFVTGMFMETLAAIIILAPILAPAAASYGIHPVHFGTLMVVNLAVGMVTPPVGVNLFVVCQVARLRLEELVRPLLIFLAVLAVDVLIISYVPALTTWFGSRSILDLISIPITGAVSHAPGEPLH